MTQKRNTVKRVQWKKELRELIAEAMVTPLNDLMFKASSTKATNNMIAARNKIIRYVEKLLTLPKNS